MHDTPDQAFAEASQQLALCPDERYVSWLREVRDGLPKDATRLRTVVMRNVVSVGVPRYVATATWDVEPMATTSSTTWPTMRQALRELVERCIEHDAARLRSSQPAPVAAADVRLRKPHVEYFQPANAKAGARVFWTEIDGAKLQASGVGVDKKAAHETAMTAAFAIHRGHRIDWQQVACRTLSGDPSITVFMRRNEFGSHVCTLLRGPDQSERFDSMPVQTELQAVEMACEIATRASKETRQLNVAQSGNAHVAAEVAMNRLRADRRALEAERSELMRTGDRTQAQEGRLRDISTLLAILDPSRRGSINMSSASRLLAGYMAQAKKAGGAARRLPKIAQLELLRALELASPTAGAAASAGRAFEVAARIHDLSSEDALDDLVVRRLVTRKKERGFSLTQNGYNLLLKHGFAKESALEAALARSAPLRPLRSS